MSDMDIEERLAALEARTGPPTAGTFVATNPNGTPGNVAAGELVESAWGNAVSNTISELWSKPIIERFAAGNVNTNGAGDFAVATGYPVLGAFANGTQVDYPTVFILREANSVQVVFRAFAADGSGIRTSTTLGVSYVILAAPTL